jgi:aldehyde:ferredoxin oxidoreductase
MSYTPEQIETYMKECIDRDHLINEQFGMTRDADTLPRRFIEEPLTEGPTAGSTVNIQKMVDEYYTLHGWE